MLTDFVQRWKRKRVSYKPAGETIQPRLYEVAEIADDRTAKEFITEHHYSMSYPSARRRFGLYFQGRLVGASVFSHPSNDRVLTKVFVGTSATDSLELGRFCLLDEVPANAESWFLARCREILSKQGFYGFIAFSDDTVRTNAAGDVIFCGHIGTIYKASNAVYLSRSTPRVLRLLPDGSVLSDRAIQKIRSGERGWIYASEILTRFGADRFPHDIDERRKWLDQWLKVLTRPLRHKGNHKYAFALHKKCKLPKGLSYPKFKIGELQQQLFL